MFYGASLRRPAAACSVSPSGPQGCRAPAPVASIRRAGVSLTAPPQVALFPGGGAVAGARQLRQNIAEELEDLIAF
jgi:hypothetical protein